MALTTPTSNAVLSTTGKRASATPPPQYTQPSVSEEVPWETRQHIQLLYQKQGELVQALTIMQQKLDALTGGKG